MISELLSGLVGPLFPRRGNLPDWRFRLPRAELSAALPALAKSLDQNGFVVVDGFMPSEVVEDIHQKVIGFCASIRPWVQERGQHENDVLVVRHDDGALDVPKSAKTVVDVRHGDDEGFLDIHNFPVAMPIPAAYLESYLDADLIFEMLQLASGKTYRVLNRNVYVNETTLRTRAFHYDDLVRTAKAFIYLTDVQTLADGPYSYVRASHNLSALRRVNRLFNRATGRHLGDCSIIDKSFSVPFLAPRGTLIVSFQNGAHRGVPQQAGHRRVLCVNTLLPSDFG
jgi:hypothetical protein